MYLRCFTNPLYAFERNKKTRHFIAATENTEALTGLSRPATGESVYCCSSQLIFSYCLVVFGKRVGKVMAAIFSCRNKV